jgi:general secretion pathway protein A
MYEDYWGLTSRPFEIQPDPRFLYPSRQHGATLSALHQAVTDGVRGAVVVGEFGAGKTSIARRVLENLAGLQYRTAYVPVSTLTPLQIVRSVLSQLSGDGLPTRLTATEATVEIQRSVAELTALGKGAVVMLDDAHAVRNRRVFDGIYAVLDATAQAGERLTVVLLGEGDLEAKLDRYPGLRSLLTVNARLHALDEEETGNLIEYRLKQAWYIDNGRLFTADAVREIQGHAGGNPLRTCEIADRALQRGMESGVRSIDGVLMRTVIMEHEGKEW